MWNPDSKTVGFPYLGRIGYYILRRGCRVFLEGREKSRGHVRALGKKRPRLFFSYVSLLTRSFKTYPINLRLPCTLWLLRRHSIQTRQISSSASWNSFLLSIKNIYSLIISFISERQKMMNARSCKGKLSTLQEGGRGRRGGGGRREVGDEWHPPKSSLYQNGFDAKILLFSG